VPPFAPAIDVVLVEIDDGFEISRKASRLVVLLDAKNERAVVSIGLDLLDGGFLVLEVARVESVLVLFRIDVVPVFREELRTPVVRQNYARSRERKARQGDHKDDHELLDVRQAADELYRDQERYDREDEDLRNDRTAGGGLDERERQDRQQANAVLQLRPKRRESLHSTFPRSRASWPTSE